MKYDTTIDHTGYLFILHHTSKRVVLQYIENVVQNRLHSSLYRDIDICAKYIYLYNFISILCDVST